MAERYPSIDKLVLHRAPMLLLDRVEDDGHLTTTCGLIGFPAALWPPDY